jgi:hypothetical protein
VKGKVCTDYWKAYGEFVPKEKHIQSKKETYTVEGYNSLFRHFLARLRRKTKCYTSFDWRHKILSSLAQFVPRQLSSEVECDELELALSNKGCRNLDREPRKRGNDFKRNKGK